MILLIKIYNLNLSDDAKLAKLETCINILQCQGHSSDDTTSLVLNWCRILRGFCHLLWVSGSTDCS